MILRFGSIELDAGRSELRRDGAPVPVEPRVLSLLLHLAANGERVVTRDELLEHVWHGRIVGDAAVSTCVKAARRIVGDTGARQAVIRTVHGQGFRFVASVRASPPVVECGGPARDGAATLPEQGPRLAGRPSIAVLRFELPGTDDGKHEGAHALAVAIPAELISALSRLRWLFVTARGSSFRLRPDDASPDTIRSLLRVGYCLSGLVEVVGPRITVAVELMDTNDGRAVWGDRFSSTLDGVHDIRAGIVAAVIAALELHVPANEADAARLVDPRDLDAWTAYHVGLQHMYRFNKRDNALAARRFEHAISKEPGFARAWAGLSFTAFQNAFLKYEPDTRGEIVRAARAAERSLEHDPLDPFANFSMGRAHWLERDLDGSVPWLERAVELSPNFAQAHYVRGLVDALSGRTALARLNTDVAMSLSPLDPMYYAMLATQALSWLGDDDPSAAASLADRSARLPGAHYFIGVIAALAHAANGDADGARRWVADVRVRCPGFRAERFFDSFPYTDGATRTRLEGLLRKLGF